MKRLLEQFAHKVLRNPIYQACTPLPARLSTEELESVFKAARAGMQIHVDGKLAPLEEQYILQDKKGKEHTFRNLSSCTELYGELKDFVAVAVTYRVEGSHLFSGVVITPQSIRTTFGYRIDTVHAPKASWKVLDGFGDMQTRFFATLQRALHGKTTGIPTPTLK